MFQGHQMSHILAPVCLSPGKSTGKAMPDLMGGCPGPYSPQFSQQPLSSS